MSKRKAYSEEEKAALRAVCKCGKLTHTGVDLYIKLFDFPPQAIKGVEPIDGERHATTIFGLVALPAYKHWTHLDALNVVAMLITEPRNMAKAEVDAVVEEAQNVYAHFGETPSARATLRAAMISTNEFLFNEATILCLKYELLYRYYINRIQRTENKCRNFQCKS